MRYLVLCLSCLLTACAGPSIQSLIDSADQEASSKGFVKENIKAGYFQLASYHRLKKNVDNLTVYIEGDGKAWISRTQLSQNPTPHNPVGLQLALADDQASSVAYVARPCQFHLSRSQKSCQSKYWSLYRYSSKVVDSTSDAIDHLKKKNGANTITLVGFSGGATVALLVAAKRDDVVAIKTVAGNLDHQAFTTLHKVTPLRGSQNPPQYKKQLSPLKQVHFVGSEDSVIPRDIFDSYYRKVGGACNQLVMVEGASHGNGWVQRWPELNAKKPAC